MLDGVLNIYKEKGYTSHDVVARMRGILKQKKIGHTGTLDPDAEGVLLVCLGQATKLCDMLTGQDKTYKAVMLLGVDTDTQDMGGQVLEEKDVICTEEEISGAVKGFIGNISQMPPMYSAVRVNGKHLYELARAGRDVERSPREVTIKDIEIGKIDLPRVEMTVNCSKGTYIRTLCHDIGQVLGCGACMESLKRTQVGRFTVENSITLSELENIYETGDIDRHLVSIEQMLCDHPAVYTLPSADNLLHNGNPLKSSDIIFNGLPDKDNLYRMYDSSKDFWGIYGYDEQSGRLKVRKMFHGGM